MLVVITLDGLVCSFELSSYLEFSLSGLSFTHLDDGIEKKEFYSYDDIISFSYYA